MDESLAISVPYTYTRRLSDKLLAAFEQACDLGLISVASQLLSLLEEQIYRENTYAGRERRDPNQFLSLAQQRLFTVTNAATAQATAAI